MAQWVRTLAKLMLMRNCIQIPDIHKKREKGGWQPRVLAIPALGS